MIHSDFDEDLDELRREASGGRLIVVLVAVILAALAVNTIYMIIS